MVTLTTPDASVFSATECLPFDLGLTCTGPTAPVLLESRHQPEPSPMPGSFFASPDCTGPVALTPLPGRRSFRVPVLANGAVAGDWELSASAAGSTATSRVAFSAKLESPATTQFVVGVCTPLPPPRLIGLNDTDSVVLLSPVDIMINTPPAGVQVCGSLSPFVLASGQNTASSMPQLRAVQHFPGVSTAGAQGRTSGGLSLTVDFSFTACFGDGGAAPNSSLCCNSATSVNDGGVICF